ncbi:KamA family radical SAM protein [candidate division KSB1 bacterium]|nr:KamA family radical SAM protein [candidate division KSB1 bacterium]
MKRNPKYIRTPEKIPQLSQKEKDQLKPVCEKFVMRTNEYYNSLIDWDDPSDPIRKIVIPNVRELKEWGDLDASNEKAYTKVPGLEHKYDYTALLLVNHVCGGFCRFCFRKRIFIDKDEVVSDVSEGLKYIRQHKKITNVLLTGGDPLLLSTNKLTNIISQLREIKHVQIIRIGSKMPAFNPFRIIDDPSLLEMIEKYSTMEKKIYIMAHFNHPRELTEEAIQAMNVLQKAGAITVNQTPLIRGVNDNPVTLSELFRKLTFIGVPPYYVFQCRPTLGNYSYAVRLEKAYEIFEQARMRTSGLGKRARFVMSHRSGKIEVVGKTENYVFMRYHRAAESNEKSKFMVVKSNPVAYWFDDYDEAVDEYTLENPFMNVSIAW